MTIENLIVIPVRLNSTRLPSKALLEVNGKTILQHTWEQCVKSKEADKVLILSPNKLICETAASFGACAKASLIGARCGSERLIDSKMCMNSKKVVSVQVDYPEIDPILIDKVFNTLSNVEPIVSAIYFHRKLKKDDVSCSFSTGQTLSNFRRDSREPIVHVGVYGFSRKILKTLDLIYKADTSETYDLEQNLWLEYGLNIRGLVTQPTISINTQEDLDRFKAKLGENDGKKSMFKYGTKS